MLIKPRSFLLQGAKIKDLPPILTLSLLRFNYDFRTFNRYKETGFYEFPYVLEMAPYCKPDDDADDDEGISGQ